MHPALCYVVLSCGRQFFRNLGVFRRAAGRLPTATNVFVIAQQYGVWVQRASASILITTVLSVGTVTALLYAIKTRHATAGPVPVATENGPGKAAAGLQALAHEEGAQRRQRAEHAEAGAARQLRRQHVRQQRDVEQVDRGRARQDVGPAAAIVGGKRCRAAGIVAMFARSAHDVLDVADAEVEALRADRREHMRRLADQRDAVLGKARGQQRRKRIDLPAGLDA